MELNVHKEVAALQRQGAKQLRARYAEAFGETTARRVKLLSRTAIAQADGACGSLPIGPLAWFKPG